MKLINKNNETNNFLLIGPPNVGKSTFFNRITWKISAVSNTDRFTTTINEGTLRKDSKIKIIDLPGMTTFNITGSDEEVTIKYLVEKKYYGVINIISALSIHRDLMLTTRLAEAGILSNITINMADEIDKSTLNLRNFEIKFKVPTSLISTKRNENVNQTIASLYNNSKPKILKLKYHSRIESFLEEFAILLPVKNLSRRFIGIEALLGKDFAINLLKNDYVYDEFIKLKNKYNFSQEEIESIKQTRQDFIDDIYKKTKTTKNNVEAVRYYQKFKKVDNFFMKPYIAIPGFILLIILIYFITFYKYAGGWIQDQFATNFLEMIQTKISDSISNDNPSFTYTWLGSFVSDGILGGIFTIIGFLPWIIILFICITIIEQIGILSRLSMVFDNVFIKFGLSGRAMVNMFTGIGCNIPGMILSRNITNQRERTISVMVSTLISCSARIVVYGFIANAIISTQWSWTLSFAVTFGSIIVSLFMALFLSNTIFRNDNSLFMVQIPRWRSLDVVVLLKRTLLEIYSFLKRTIIIVGIFNFVIWFLSNTGPVSSFIIDIETGTKSFLNYIAIPFKYLFYPIGLGFDDRWSVVLLSAFPAKEVAASTIDTLFNGSEGFKASLDAISNHGYQTAILTSFIIMLTFYVPCLATVFVMKKEIGWKYTLISIGYCFAMTYLLSWIAFNFIAIIITITNHGIYSIPLIVLLIISIVICLVLIIFHQIRTKLQNMGIYEKYDISKRNKKINYVAITTLISCFIVINVLVLMI